MIKFFRHIRRTLINQNNMGKYFKYAIGEILLVVIGILIALQINNWNERKQNTLKVNNLLEKIQKDIEIDLDEIVNLAKFYHVKDSISYLVLNDKLTIEDYQNSTSGDLIGLVYNYSEINLKNNSYDNLIRYQDIIPKEYDALLEQLYIQYSDHFNYVAEVEDTYKDGMEKFHEYLFENYEWYSNKFSPQNTESFDYYLNNIRYKGMVNEYQGAAIYNYLKFNIDYAFAAIDTYKQINEALNIENPKPIFDFKTDSTLLGTYRSLFNYDFVLVEDANRDYVITEADTVDIFQYDTNKFFMQNNFIRIDKVNDSINFYVSGFENGAKPFATKID